MAMQSGKEASVSKERIWREQFAQLVSAEEIRSLSEQSLPDTFGAIGLLWVEVAVLLTAANLLPRLPLAWAVPAGVASVLLMGLRMNAFGVILHEGSHGLLAKSRKLNDRICNWGSHFGRSTRSKSIGQPTVSTIDTWDRSGTLTEASIWCHHGAVR